MIPIQNGFCNDVFEVSLDDHKKAIVKVYSEASKIRVDSSKRGEYEEIFNNLGIAPAVIALSESGIAHEFIDGKTMKENDVHSSDKFSQKLARIVSKLHSERQEDCADRKQTCLTWKWFDLMLKEIENSSKELPSIISYEILREEVRRNRFIIESANFPITLTHGDLKPSNIMILQDNSLQLIDLELSGSNYRGFDLMKLFRANREIFSEERFFKFLQEYCYLIDIDNYIAAGGVEKLALECRTFEPLTWLEAAIFFLFLICISDKMEVKAQEENIILFKNRWEAYQESMWLLSHYNKETYNI